MQFPMIIVFVLYTVLMLGIGYYFYRRNGSIDDYFLGGRSINPYVTAMSAEASDMSGWLLLGLPGAAFAGGFSILWLAISLAVCTYLNWQFTAKRLRRYTEVVNAITIADFLEQRFRDRSRSLRLISAVVILFFFTIYVASGLISGGVFFGNIFDLDYKLAIYLTIAVVGVYTFLGGFMAISWTEFVQGLLMFLALFVTPIVLIVQMGGPGALWAKVSQVSPGLLDAMKVVNYKYTDAIQWTGGGELNLIGVISLLSWGLGYFGMPHILVRFMGIRSAKELPIAQLVGVTWVVISLLGAILVGILGVAAVGPVENQESIFLVLMKQFFNPWLAGLFLIAVLAAIMSTLDSQLLVSSSTLAQDFYKSFFRPKASQRELLWVSRATVVIVVLVALFIALSGGKILDMVGYAWAGIGASFGPTILFALYWKRTTRNGALAGIIAGGLGVILWKHYFAYTGFYEMIPGFICSSVLIVLVSLLDKHPAAEIESEFERAKRPLSNE